MKLSRLAILAAPLALVAAACGGNAGSAAFRDAAPSYSALSMNLTNADTTAPALAASGGSTTSALTMMPGGDTCHPHLFVRTHDVVQRVNRHLWRALRHVEAVIAHDPTLATGADQVWERTANGIDVKFTMTRVDDTHFTWKLEMRKVADAAFTTVMSGDIDRTLAQGPHQGVGDVTIDLGALASVNGDDVAGVITAQFTTLPGQRTLVVDAKGVIWDTDAFLPVVRQPRDAHYVYDREPGKGGSLKIEEQMVFACPSNIALAPADVKLVTRWYRTSSGTVNGRSDALMTGGQLAATNQVVGVTCHSAAADGDDQAEAYWLMKLEDETTTPPGNTVTGGAVQSGTAGADTCDPALNPPSGSVPNLNDASTDFDMSVIDFTDATPYPFPGM